MATEVKNSDIIQENIFENTIDSAKALIKVLDSLESSFKDILETSLELSKSTPLKGYENITKVVGLIEDAEKAVQGLNEVSTRRIEINEQIQQQNKIEQKQASERKKQLTDEEKLTKLLNGELDEEIKTRLKLQRAMQNQRKELKDLLILEDEEAGTLDKLRAKNRLLTRERERLNLDTEDGRQRLIEINEELDRNNELIRENSDALTQQRINIGNYAEGVRQGISESEEFGAILSKLDDISNGLIGRLINLTRNTESSADAADEAGGRWKKFSNVVKKSVVGIIIAAIALMTKSFTASRKGAIALQIKMEQLSNSFTLIGSALIKQFKGIFAQLKNGILNIEKFGLSVINLKSILKGDAVPAIDEVNKKIEENKEAIEKGANAFDGFTDKFKSLNQATADFLRNQADINDTIAKLGIEIIELAGFEEQLQAIADDSTKSFNEQEDAQRKALAVAENRLKLEKQIATLQLNQAITAVERDLLSQNIKIEESQIRNLDFLNDRNLALKVSEESVNSLTDAVGRLAEIENEQSINSLNAARTIQEISRDRFERELDFAIDAFDAVKTKNERIIGSDTKTLKEQDKLFQRTNKLAESSFNEQIKLIESYSNQRLNINELVAIDDERIIRERVRQFKLDDVVLGRLLEIIRERKAVTQDIADLEKDIADKVAERAEKELTAAQNLAEFRNEVQINLAREEFNRQKEALKDSEEFDEIKLQQTKSSLKKLIDIEISAEELRRDNLLNNTELIEDERQKIIEESEEKIRQIRNKSIEEQKNISEEANKNDNEQLKDTLSTASELLESFYTKFSEKRLDAIDSAIEKTEERQEQLREAAEKGAEKVTENLAIEQKRQAELEAKREKELQRQKAFELGLTALKLYSSKIDSGEKNPLGSTIADISLLTAFVSSIPAFFEGTNDRTVGETLGQPDLPGRDGYIVRVDKDETILSPEKTKEYHNFIHNNDFSGKIAVKSDMNNHLLIQKMSAIESAIRNKPTYTGGDFKEQEKAFVASVEMKNKRIRNHYKLGF